MVLRLSSAGVMVLGLTLVSGAPYSVAPMPQHPKALEPSLAVGETLSGHVVTTFELRSANTLEAVTVRYVDGVLDPASKQQVDHLMRCLRTDSAKPIDPRLIDALRDIAHEIDAPLWLVSGYRAPEHYYDANYHNRGQAADIRVESVPAYKLRRLAKRLGVRGVGFYPTTNMVHVDTRDEPYFWTDWSGPHQIGREVRTQ